MTDTSLIFHVREMNNNSSSTIDIESGLVVYVNFKSVFRDLNFEIF